jgi:3-oxoacyl-[acyl-carrier-protein] synthase III
MATGTALPAKRVTAAELDSRLGLPEGSTLRRNGVALRYFADESETSSGLGTQALRCALQRATLHPEQLDAILFASVLSEQPMPTAATLVHQALGCRASGVSCADLNASCGGIFKGLEWAGAMIAAGAWRYVAVLGVELGSRGLCWEDLDTATLFGDGAAAIVLGPAEGAEGILKSKTVTLSDASCLATVAAGGTKWNVRQPPASERDYFFRMDGMAMLKLAREWLPGFVEEMLAGTAVRHVAPHQASAVGLASLRKLLRKHENITYTNVFEEFGNQVTASVGVALDRAICGGAIARGDEVFLLGTAAGLALHGIVLRY